MVEVVAPSLPYTYCRRPTTLLIIGRSMNLLSMLRWLLVLLFQLLVMCATLPIASDVIALIIASGTPSSMDSVTLFMADYER